ncbi:MAG: glycosyltransferase family 4 protein [Phenylobacterium sp.]|uniref:glycosyltransferase family 4 protein n=1 Tax=Phenylobacterium sp. TaxID=1871053 RepID=UPI00391D0974
MKLHVYTPEFLGSGGGVATYYRGLLPALAELGCRVRVTEGGAARAVPGGDRRSVGGVEVEVLDLERLDRWRARLPALDAAPRLQRDLAAAWAMWELSAGAGEAEVVEACDFGLSFVPPILAGGPPAVVQMHGGAGQLAIHDPLRGRELDGLLALAVETAVLPAAAAVQTLSAANAAYWSAQSARTVSVRRPAWAPGPRVEPSPGERLVVIGRLQRWKGPHVLCEALRALGPGAPGVDWYGRDTEIERPGRRVSAWLAERYPDIWGDRLRRLDPIPPEAVAARQASALLNIVPSTWDVFNLTAVEAMASGRPLVISNGAGASELVADGETGFVYAGDDPAALAQAIARALSLPPARLAEIGAAARAQVIEALAPARIAAERIAAYEAARTATAAAPVADFAARVCRPAGAAADPDFAFLEGHPLSALAAHVARRGLGKVFGR